jgi:hypothetical protein
VICIVTESSEKIFFLSERIEILTTGFLDLFEELTHEKALKKRSDINKILKILSFIVIFLVSRHKYQDLFGCKNNQS